MMHSPAHRSVCAALALVLAMAPMRPVQSAEGDGAGAKEEDYFDLEEKVTSVASKRPLRSTEAPAIINVITDEHIRQHGYRSVGEALRWVPGFYPLGDPAYGDGVFYNFGVRGVNAGARGASRILKVMIDGQPTAFRSTTGNFLGPELVPMSAVEKIEVVRGPGSALYGANAFLGVVNVVTKTGRRLVRSPEAEKAGLREEDYFKAHPDEKRPDGVGGRLSLTGEYIETTGRFGGGVEGVGGGAIGPLQGMAAASAWHLDRSGVPMPDSAPLFAGALINGRIESDTDLAKPLSLYSRLQAGDEKTAYGRFTVHGGMQRLDSVNEWQDLEPLPFIGPAGDVQPVHSRQQINNGFTRVVHEGWWGSAERPVETNVSLGYATGAPDSGDKFDTGVPSQFFIRLYDYQSFDIAASVGYQFIDALHITVGMDHTSDFHHFLTYKVQDRDTGIRNPAQFARARTILNSALYGQAILTPIEPLSFTMGVRWDANSIYGDQVNGRAGAVWRIVPGPDPESSGLTLKALFGSSFQAPSPELLFGRTATPGDIERNQDLLPQRAYSWEAQLGYRTGAYGLSVNGFYNEIKDLAVFQRESLNLTAVNAANLRSYGFEVEGFVRLGDLALRASTSYQRTLEEEARGRTPADLFVTRERDIFPRWMVTFGPSYKVPVAPLILSWDNQWVDSRPASDTNVSVNEGAYELSDYFLSTLTLASTDFKLGAGGGGASAFGMFQVVDLFNERFGDPGFNGVDYPSVGRRYVLTLGLRF